MHYLEIYEVNQTEKPEMKRDANMSKIISQLSSTKGLNPLSMQNDIWHPR